MMERKDEKFELSMEQLEKISGGEYDNEDQYWRLVRAIYIWKQFENNSADDFFNDTKKRTDVSPEVEAYLRSVWNQIDLDWFNTTWDQKK